MKTIFRHRGIGGLLFAQSQVAFNDNAIKLVLIGLVQMLLPVDQASSMVSLIALLLVAPFVLFAPLTGWLADRFPHRDVLMGSLWLQLAIMALLLTGTLLHSLPLAIGGFFLLGLQSALMSPARRGMVKDLAGDNVGEVIGWMEMLCIAAILAGSLAGGQMIDGLAAALHGPWLAGTISCILLTIGCALALAAFRNAPRHPAAGRKAFGMHVILGHIDLIKTLRRNPSLWRAALGDSAFYLAGGMLMLLLSHVGRTLHPDGLGAARATGIMLALVGAGIAAGSIVAARLSRHTINMGLVPVGAAGIAASLALLGLLPLGGTAFHGGLLALGISGGLFLVPLGAFLVDRSPEGERGRILAASSMLSSIAGVAAVAVHALINQTFGLSLSTELFLMAGGLLAVAILSLRFLSADFLRLAALTLARQHYRVKTLGVQNIPLRGGALIVCNHVSYVDTIILSLASPRPIRFLSYEGFFQMPVLGSLLRIFGAIPVSATRAKEGIRRAAEHIQQGEIVCIFPEGQLTRTGSLMELKSGFELIARRAGCPVIVAHLDGLWGSIFSFDGGRYFTKWPSALHRRATVSFREPLTPEHASTHRVRLLMLDLGAAAFAQRPCPSLAAALIHALRSRPWRTVLFDHGSERRTIRAFALLGSSLALARRWQILLPARRVGILLPPGIAGTVANLAVLFAGKVPVNLNPLLSPQAASSCLALSNVNTIVTAAPLLKKFPRFPWPDRVFLIEKEISTISPLRLILALLRGFLAPGTRRTYSQADTEAVLLFTSGSSGLPKGVALTHRNILSNITQVSETAVLRHEDRMLTALPLFHSFGLSMGLFFPLLTRKAVVSVTSSLECDKIAEAARDDLPTVILSTPTFLNNYTKRITRDAFGTLRLAVTGAEKLRPEIAAAFYERFGCEVLEGYGLTEASPGAAFNMPNPPCGLGAETIQIGSRAGSVGRLMPGLSCRLLDPETEKECTGHGILALRGANILSGYLEGVDAGKFHDGWFITGDIARMDADGFVFIEGRQSRFSKIGGEMVSHTAIEEAITRLLPSIEGPSDCVLGRPCPDKGEELVLLTTRALDRETLAAALKAASLPNLWIPREIIRVDRIPTLGTGKLDIASCRRMAEMSLQA